jgi:Alpha/beta hydrolase domain
VRDRRAGFRGGVGGALALSLLLAACSSSSDKGSAAKRSNAGSTPPTPSTVPRPAGPVADVTHELTGGNGPFIGSAITKLDKGYVEHEYLAQGSATSYTEGKRTHDGRWTFRPDTTAEYRTRVLVRQPEDPAAFSGVVLVEWLNVSGGVDADPDYVTTHEEITRQGDVWVGVSAQSIGVEGGPVAVKVDAPGAEVAGKGLKGIDSARYGSLHHPGDGFAFDIYTQVARALREGGPVLGGLVPSHIVALGESQSAFALVTYINGVQPLTHAFDGFFLHSRGGSSIPLVPVGQPADIAGSIGGPTTIVRTDTDVPVFDLQSESDVVSIIGSLAARQPDSKRFRLWEVAGTSHADTRLLGDNANSIDCGLPINDGPQHVVAKAALHDLIRWITAGVAPPTAARLEVTGAPPALQRDADGIALGGVRTPLVDVPVRVVSSVPGPVSSVICLLLGSTKPLPAARLAQLYPSRADYEKKYAAAVDLAIKRGYVLEADRAALEAYEHSELVPA